MAGQPMFWDHRNKCACGWSIGLLVVGALMVGLSVPFFWFIGYELRNGIEEAAVITSADPTNENYQMWQNNYGPDSPKMYECYYFYNLTNADAVVQGGKPSYQEVGPYCYWYMRSKFNISWSSDENTVTYNYWQRFIFDQNESYGRVDSDIVTNINPSYMGLLATAGSETLLLQGFCGPSVYYNILWLVGPYISHLTTESSPVTLTNQTSFLITELENTGNYTQADATTEFYAQWANATTPLDTTWNGMLVSQLSGNASGITLDTAMQMFNSSIEYSLTNANSVNTWYNATYGGGGVNNTAIGLIQNAFMLTDAQMAQVLQWYSQSFRPTIVEPYLVSKHASAGVNTTSDLGWLQFGSCSLTHKGVQQAYWDAPNTGTPGDVEYGCGLTKLSVAVSQQTMNGTLGLKSMLNMDVFSEMIASPRQYSANITANWGLSYSQALSFGAFLLGYQQPFARPYIEKVFADGGGLFTTKSIRRWIFNSTDPLLAIADPASLPSSNIQQNETSEDESYTRFRASTYYTGKNNISQVAQFLNWMGMSDIPYPAYAQDVPVYGTNDWGQFEPFLQKKGISELQVFDTHYIRTLALLKTEEVENEGIKMWRFVLSNDTFAPNPIYFQNITGFCNMSGTHNDTPIFQSNPHFYGASDEWLQKVDGVVPSPSTDYTFADVEPWTGKVMRANQSLQVNIYIPSDTTQFTLFNPNVTKDIMYPLLWVRDSVILTSANAHTWNMSVELALGIQYIGSTLMLVLGAVCLLVSLSLFIFVYMRKSSGEVVVIDGSEDTAIVSPEIGGKGTISTGTYGGIGDRY